MDEETFFKYTSKVAKSLVENAGHSFNVPFFELNELLIEIERREREKLNGNQGNG